MPGMSAHPSPPHSGREITGEQVLFVLAAAFGVVLAAIIFAAFLPIALGVGIVFAVLAVVMVVVGIFLGKLLED